VADSPNRKTARPLSTLGGVEPDFGHGFWTRLATWRRGAGVVAETSFEREASRSSERIRIQVGGREAIGALPLSRLP
jgi:hypothetical protein